MNNYVVSAEVIGRVFGNTTLEIPTRFATDIFAQFIEMKCLQLLNYKTN